MVFLPYVCVLSCKLTYLLKPHFLISEMEKCILDKYNLGKFFFSLHTKLKF